MDYKITSDKGVNDGTSRLKVYKLHILGSIVVAGMEPTVVLATQAFLHEGTSMTNKNISLQKENYCRKSSVYN